MLVVAAVVALLGCRGGPARTPEAEPDRQPSFGDQTIEAQTWVVGQAVNLQLPAAAGGDPPLVYDLDPDVPGMTFDADAQTWSGAPRAETPPADLSMTYRVTDADGDTAALTFAVIVWRRPYCPPPKPPFPLPDPPVRLRDPLSVPTPSPSCPPWWPGLLRKSLPDRTEQIPAPWCAVIPTAGPRAYASKPRTRGPAGRVSP